MGRSARRTTSHAVDTSGMRDHASHSRCTRRPRSAARSHSAANAVGGVVDAPRPSEDLGGVERSGPHGLGHGQELVLAVAEDVQGVDVDRDATRRLAAPGVHHHAGSTSATTSPWSSSMVRISASLWPVGMGPVDVAPPQGDGVEAGAAAASRRSRKLVARGKVPEHSTSALGPRGTARGAQKSARKAARALGKRPSVMSLSCPPAVSL